MDIFTSFIKILYILIKNEILDVVLKLYNLNFPPSCTIFFLLNNFIYTDIWFQYFPNPIIVFPKGITHGIGNFNSVCICALSSMS